MDYETTFQKQTEYNENIYGNILKFQIFKYKENTLKVKIKNSKTRLFPRKVCFLIVCAVVINLLCLVNILCVEYLYAVFLALILLFIHNLMFTVRQECLLVMKSLGYQIETKYILGKSTQFIPWSSVDYVFINEVISLHRVLFVLTMFTKEIKDKQSLIPLFMATKPRLKCLETVYQELKKL